MSSRTPSLPVPMNPLDDVYNSFVAKWNALVYSDARMNDSPKVLLTKCTDIVRASPFSAIVHSRFVYWTMRAGKDEWTLGALLLALNEAMRSLPPKVPTTHQEIYATFYTELVDTHVLTLCDMPYLRDSSPTKDLILVNLLHVWECDGHPKVWRALAENTVIMCDVLWEVRYSSSNSWIKSQNFHRFLCRYATSKPMLASSPAAWINTRIPHITLLCWYQNPTSPHVNSLLAAAGYFIACARASDERRVSDLIQTVILDRKLMRWSAFFQRTNGTDEMHGPLTPRDHHQCLSLFSLIVGHARTHGIPIPPPVPLPVGIPTSLTVQGRNTDQGKIDDEMAVDLSLPPKRPGTLVPATFAQDGQ
ncbi:hypothetical protein OF83DRAFT_1176181 [Amylostereum chailletii]|nr:hypothetical protein OF83DRAFT_1176181 [Amylostereum chailletii]